MRPQQGNGGACTADDQCQSGSYCCPSGGDFYCGGPVNPGQEHTCVPQLANGGNCTDASQCRSGYCVQSKTDHAFTVCCDSPCTDPCSECEDVFATGGPKGTCSRIRDEYTFVSADGTYGFCCSGTFANPSDPNNCGLCGNVCLPGQTCAPYTGVAFNDCYCFLDSNGRPQHCPAGQTCFDGTCCSDGQVACSGTCTSLSSDPNNCGACGTVCDHGTCQTTCSAGFTACNGACLDVSSDPNNCGACNYPCCTDQGPFGCPNGICCGQPGAACFTDTALTCTGSCPGTCA